MADQENHLRSPSDPEIIQDATTPPPEDEASAAAPAVSTTDEQSDSASTPTETPENGSAELKDLPKRVPSLRSVSDRAVPPSSTARDLLGRARNPFGASSSFASRSGGALDSDVMAKARALSQQRLQKGMTPPANSPISPGPGTPTSGNNPGFPRMQAPLVRPGPGVHHNSAPAPLGGKPSLASRRGGGLKLSDMSSPSPSPSPSPGIRRAGAPKLSDMTIDKPVNNGPAANPSSGLGTRLDDFKKYIDTEKGWITFAGAATITREGVNFENGQTFRISLDEIDTIGELGKGNYGTVYKVRHSKPTAPRFGQGLSGFKASHSQSTTNDDTSQNGEHSLTDGTTGQVMAMKEIRLELDDAKFSTILKELVILHECVSPYIISFYGAFYQEGSVYMCIEYMDGGSVDKLYKDGIPENILRKITNATVQGLKCLKDDHNIIHRDVKPTNILMNTRGQIKICDFGVSGNLVASIAKTNIGCQSYMAPERISSGGMAQGGGSDGTYSVQSDVWSLGLTIIECAMGQYPYPPEISASIFSQLSVSFATVPFKSEMYAVLIQI